MKKFTVLAAVASLALLPAAASANRAPAPADISKHLWHYESGKNAFDSRNDRLVEQANNLMWRYKPERFNDSQAPLKAKKDSAGNYQPDAVRKASDMLGEILGPDRKTWYYDLDLHYYSFVHNEWYTEQIPDFFKVTLYDSDMKQVAVVQDSLRCKPDERRVRLVTVLEVLSQHYYNSDDDYELAIGILTNPRTYGIRANTHIYRVGEKQNEVGCNTALKVIPGVVSDLLDASTDGNENFIMTYVTEGNSTGYKDSDLRDPDKYWEYQLGNYFAVSMLGAADSTGNQSQLFYGKKIYYQTQGNQQDDPTVMTMLHNGKATLVFPYYEKVYYKPFYSINDDLVAADDNRLIVELWQQPEPGKKFEMIQRTPIDVIHDDAPDVIWSYYGIGSFNWTSDVAWDGDKANLIITRRDYVASSDTERKSYLIYNADGSLRRTLFENSQSIAFMADLPGFDPQTLFINHDGLDYIFNFMNMRTFEIELRLNYGLRLDPNDDPDYIMANIDRTLTPDGKSYQYVAEMRMPEYDDVNDCNYMRVAWISREGLLQRIDKVNMGNKVNYAKLFLGSAALRPDFFHSDDNQEYMILIKRYIGDYRTEEQLLIGQALNDTLPLGRDLMLLRPCEYGNLRTIDAYNDGNRDVLTVLYTNDWGGTLCYYNLPLDADETPDPGNNGIGSINIDTDSTPRYYNLQGMPVDITKAPDGIYLRRLAGKTAKFVHKNSR